MRTSRHAPGNRPVSALAACLLIVMIVAAWSCKDSITGEGPFNDIVFPDSNISYNALIQPLFNRACSFSGGCHAGEDPAASLSLESYQRLTERVGIVVPGSPDESILQLRIEGRITPRMPLNRPALTENQIRGIARWILEGGINN
ncbi:MAG TPA: c-type cytochrome domain-containing protein [Bacteroidota bacterium]|nr:c-type cytochrome domain-containing protein [Bacteroidota bacterium]